MPKECKPLSNAEVNKIMYTHLVRKASKDVDMGRSYSIGNEQGNELRKQTMEYLELFNEFQLEDQIKEIRK